MKVMTVIETMQQTAKLWQKPCMYLNFQGAFNGENWLDELLQAAPYLNVETHGQFLADGVGVIVFETEEEMYQCYEQTKGDDPNKNNKYTGPARIYALTCNAKGDLQNENT